MSASTHLPHACFEKILDFLFRCTYVDGSTMLITRCSLVGWVESCLACRQGASEERLRRLAARVYDTSDRSRVDIWSGDGIAPVVQSLQKCKGSQ